MFCGYNEWIVQFHDVYSYLPYYHESRDALRDLGAEKHHYINLAKIENRLAGLCSDERSKANE
ncbi:MAG: hypothetical protein ACL7BU_01980 [Candidatus Phlomobacter fragariae]